MVWIIQTCTLVETALIETAYKNVQKYMWISTSIYIATSVSINYIPLQVTCVKIEPNPSPCSGPLFKACYHTPKEKNGLNQCR